MNNDDLDRWKREEEQREMSAPRLAFGDKVEIVERRPYHPQGIGVVLDVFDVAGKICYTVTFGTGKSSDTWRFWESELRPSPTTPSLNAKQPPPADGTGPDCWQLVLADMEERRRIGIERYGKPVRPDNGRDALVDLYQELLDACVYIRQAIEQRNNAK